MHHLFLVGAILTRLGEHGMDHPNVYASQKLNKDKRNYSTIEQEGLGMVFTSQKYHHDL